MCGIAGMIARPGDAVTAEQVRRMTDTIVHRGPDDEGIHVRGNVGLGMRRLSIIDLSGGHQPIYNEDRSVAVVFNGEIYNFQELRQELESHGHQFHTHSDTEVIVHLYEEMGANCVTKLRGMFAIALYDEKCNALLLARDRLGKKPLFYSEPGGSSLDLRLRPCWRRRLSWLRLIPKECCNFSTTDMFPTLIPRSATYENSLPATWRNTVTDRFRCGSIGMFPLMA